MVFLNEDEEKRTNESFRQRSQPEHHRENSPIERLSSDTVKQVPLDYLHLILVGLAKLLVKMMMSPKTFPKLNAMQLEQISLYFFASGQYIPREFARKPQTLNEFKQWKATTFRLFLLYVGPIILQNILPKEYLEHFNVLSCAIRILCHPKHYLIYNDYAKDLLIYFVQKFKMLYGEEYVTWNVHNLIHLADDAKEYGPLDNFSAFPYENYMQTIKKFLRKKGRPLQQIHRRLTEQKYYYKKNNVEIEYPIMVTPINKVVPPGCHKPHRTLKFSQFEIRDTRPNNCCLIKGNKGTEIFVVDCICKNNVTNESILFGRSFLNEKDLPNYPMSSSQIGICEVAGLSPRKKILSSAIINKYCLIYHNSKTFAVPLLHNS